MHIESLLAGHKASAANLILGLASLDFELMAPISRYSNLAAVSADREDYYVTRNKPGSRKQNAMDRHARREMEALAEVDVPDPRSAQRKQIVAILRERGVVFGGGYATNYTGNPCLGVAQHLANQVRAHRAFESAWAKYPGRRLANQPSWDACKAELTAAGVL